jgi:hypothetical protein
MFITRMPARTHGAEPSDNLGRPICASRTPLLQPGRTTRFERPSVPIAETRIPSPACRPCAPSHRSHPLRTEKQTNPSYSNEHRRRTSTSSFSLLNPPDIRKNAEKYFPHQDVQPVPRVYTTPHHCATLPPEPHPPSTRSHNASLFRFLHLILQRKFTL